MYNRCRIKRNMWTVRRFICYTLYERSVKIEIEKVSVEGYQDTFLRVKSENKSVKESSMDEKLTQRFEQRLEYLKQGLSLPRRLKRITAVHEHVGRLKDQFSSVAKYYQIDYCKWEITM